MVEYHPLEPFLPPNAKLLMLGSFPPPKKRWSMDFFYPNRTNMMWEVVGLALLGDSKALVDDANKTFRLEKIISLLNEKGIALFDTASAVRRLKDNASDKYLEVVQKTDIPTLLKQIPLCHDIVCTGQKSAETLCSDYGATIPTMGGNSPFTIAGRPMRLHRMPSTSRAYPMKLELKANYYSDLFYSIGI